MLPKFVLPTAGTLLLLLLFQQLISRSNGAPEGRTGAPGELTCQNSCHNSFTLNSGPGFSSITSNIPESGYLPGETYQIELKIKEADIQRFGFGATVYGVDAQSGIGQIQLTDLVRTKMSSFGNREYLTHTSSGIDIADSNVWAFDWIAPPPGSGSIAIHAAFVSANKANGNKNDRVYTQSLHAIENLTAGVDGLDYVESLRLFPTQITDEFSLDLDLSRQVDLQLEVLNMGGEPVYRYSRFAGPGSFTHKVQSTNWATGVYVLRLRSGRTHTMRKLLVLR